MLDKHPVHGQSPERRLGRCGLPDAPDQVVRQKVLPERKLGDDGFDDISAIVRVVEKVPEDVGFDQRALLVRLIALWTIAGVDCEFAAIEPASVNCEGFGIDLRQVHRLCVAPFPGSERDVLEESRLRADDVVMYEMVIAVTAHPNGDGLAVVATVA